MIQCLNRMNCGIILMIIAESLFALAWAAIKTLGGRMPLFEVIFFRATLSLILLTGIMLWRKSSFKGKNYKLLLLRGLLGFGGIVCSFYAMTKMMLGNASILLNTFPLFVALLAPLLIGERFKPINFLFVILAFAGIILIIKPTQHIIHNVAMIGLMSGIFAALSVISVRKLTHTDSSSVITFYFTAFVSAASLPFVAKDFIFPTRIDWLLIVGMALAVTMGQLLMTKAYSYAHAATISPFAYISVLLSYILGVIIWNDVPDLVSLTGGVLIVVSGVAITVTEGRIKPISPT
jgi:drug/metabolite transporter (DMT)-like permease